MSTHPGSSRNLIVGATGQLGAALLHQLGPAALPAARRASAPDWLHLDLEQIAADPTTLDGLIERHNITAVYCAAGATNVERCESDPAWASAANHLGPLALARAARHIPFVFFSTDYVFDGRKSTGNSAGPYAEDARPNPLSVYGRTKRDGERAALDAHPAALVLRTTTVYGPDPQAKNFLYTLRRLLTEGKPMRVPLDQFATPTYNEDLAAAAISLVAQRQTGLVHVAGPDFLSRHEFALAACSVLALDPSAIHPVATSELHQAAARPLLGGLRIDKLQSLLGPHCMRPISAGLRDWIFHHSAGSSMMPAQSSESPQSSPEAPPSTHPRRHLQWLIDLFPAGQFVRYLCVGCFNTLFGYTTYVIAFSLLNAVIPERFLYLTAPAAAVLTLPLNITVAYFGYKLFVFRTHGNYLREWLKCFAVYGSAMLPGLLLLALLTHILQSLIHRHAAALHAALPSVEAHLSGRPLHLLEHLAKGPAMAGYIAGALVIGVSTIYSFIGHKKVTFRTRSPA